MDVKQLYRNTVVEEIATRCVDHETWAGPANVGMLVDTSGDGANDSDGSDVMGELDGDITGSCDG